MSMFKKINYIFNRKQKIHLVILFFMVLVGSACELMGVTMILPFIDAVLAQEAVLEKCRPDEVISAIEMEAFDRTPHGGRQLSWVCHVRCHG